MRKRRKYKKDEVEEQRRKEEKIVREARKDGRADGKRMRKILKGRERELGGGGPKSGRDEEKGKMAGGRAKWGMRKRLILW